MERAIWRRPPQDRSRSTGHYVHSLDDVGRIERVPRHAAFAGAQQADGDQDAQLLQHRAARSLGTERSLWAGRAKGWTPRSRVRSRSVMAMHHGALSRRHKAVRHAMICRSAGQHDPS